MKWYQVDYGEVFRSLQTSEQGLSEAELKERLEKYGPNRLPEVKSISRLKIILHQFTSPLRQATNRQPFRRLSQGLRSKISW